MTKTEVFADTLQNGDVIRFDVSEQEFELRTVKGVMANTHHPLVTIYVDEGAPIVTYRNDPIEVFAGPSKNL